MNKQFYKHPLFIIFVLFIAGYFLLQHYATDYLSDEPLVITKANPPEIIMYGTKSCMYCYIAKEFFKKHQLAYTEYDIEQSDEYMQKFFILGGSGTPLMIINKQIIHGFDESLIREAL